MEPAVLAVAVFAAVYAAIVSERIERTAAAMAGGMLVILFSVERQDEAFRSIDLNTIGLLIGMMVLVSILRQTGVFRYVAIRLARLAGARPWRITLLFVLFTAVASAFLDNVTTVLLMLPITLTIAEHLKIDPRPMLIAQIVASNVGGTATLIGDPPNIIIGSATGLTFAEFAGALVPAVVLILATMIAYQWFTYGRKAPAGPGLAAIADLDERGAITNRPLLWKALAVTVLTLVGFVLHGALHLEPATIALSGATVLIVVGGISVNRALEEVEWDTIMFFAGLFVVVGALEHVGVLDAVARWAVSVTGGNVVLTVLAVLWLSALASAIVDNIPAVASLVPVVFAVARLTHPGVPDEALVRLPDILPVWWALALGACLGGNGTLVGASANVVVAGAAARVGYPIGFWQFARTGVPVTLLSLAIASVYLLVRYAL